MAARFSLLGERRERRGNSVDLPVEELNRQLGTEPHVEPIHLFFGPRTECDTIDDKPVLHAERKIHKTRAAVWMESEPKEVDPPQEGTVASAAPFVRRGSFNSRVQAVGKYWGAKVLQAVGKGKDQVPVHPDSFCDGCGMDPIVGSMFTCSSCANYHLCSTCYRNGIHGFETSKLLQKVKNDYQVETMLELCKHRVPEEVFSELMENVCRGQVDKFKFLANWICGVVNGHTLGQLAVRGIEIPHVHPSTRSRFVSLLMPALTERQDMEVSMEWFPNEPDRQTLRIWVCTDKETKSPFAPKKPPGAPVSPIIITPTAAAAAASLLALDDPSEGSMYSPPPMSSAASTPPHSPVAIPLSPPTKRNLSPSVHVETSPNMSRHSTASNATSTPKSPGAPKYEIRHSESMDGPCTPRFSEQDDDENVVEALDVELQFKHEEMKPLSPLVVKAITTVDDRAVHTPHPNELHDSF
ncbi:hypothetical protein DYB32_004946 [Aphanomyces invadans]|uniref:ZZ-type domain-containing protein n=1 Tax=Aphanomyces invadans TaxID=157072 RepID=A0A418AW16_9STRA|nr:hypothetical protein DYB32_004946 [Aphanomyces invadans]